jgi:hypothetical protein
MKKEYINIWIGKHEIKRTLRDVVAVTKTSKNVCFLKETGYKNFGYFDVD